jgi:nucleotide-binding universal stress UspA family protein
MESSNQRILVGIDGSSHAVSALNWALAEAAASRREVEAVFVWQVPTLAYSAPGYIPIGEAEVEQQGQACFDQALSEVKVPDSVQVTLKTAEGSPAEVLASLAKAEEVAEVVVGARGHGGVAGLLLGSVSHSLTHHCPKPLTVVPAGWDSTDDEVARRRVVVGVDGSPCAKLALTWAASIARARRVPLEAVMVVPTAAPIVPSDRLAEVCDSPEAMEALREFVSDVDTSEIDVRFTILGGHPAPALTARSSDAQLLVLGTRGHGWARETISGSVSHSCTHKAVVPIAIVPKGR